MMRLTTRICARCATKFCAMKTHTSRFIAIRCSAPLRVTALLNKAGFRFWWKKFYRLVCAIVAWDHRGVLRAAFVSREQWMRDTSEVFENAANEIFPLQTVYNEAQRAKETAT